MKRYEIQDMVAQSQQGVTYMAHDKQSGKDVALRRFFPFGPAGGGLEGEAAREYEEKCQSFTSVTHPGLRAVVGGGVDSTDETPYLVTEWIDGHPLTHVLGESKLDAARAMDVARNALEVSLELSKVFGEEAVWVDTDPYSIIVGSVDSGRGFTFWVSLSSWFNLEPGQRQVRAVAKLVEALVGWDSKVYTEESAGGFGGWVKAMKSSPTIKLQEALDQLIALANPGASPDKAAKVARPAQAKVTPKPVPVARPTAKPVAKAARAVAMPSGSPTQALSPTQAGGSSGTTQKGLDAKSQGPSKSKAWLKGLVAIAACLAVVAGMAVLVQNNRESVRAQLAKNEEIEKANQEAEAKAMLAAGLVEEAEPAISEPAPNNGTAQEAAPKADGPTILGPDDVAAIQKLEQDAPVQVSGTLTHAAPLGDSGNIALYFSKPYKKGQIRALAGKQEFEGALDIKSFSPYVGKEITVAGIYRYWAPGEAHYVRFKSLEQVSIDGGNAGEVPAEAQPIQLTPDDYARIAKLPSKHPARIQGVVNAVAIPGTASCLEITFAESAQSKRIRVIACPSSFDDKKMTKEDFALVVQDLQFIVGKTVLINGAVSRFGGQPDDPFIRINRRDQIKVFK